MLRLTRHSDLRGNNCSNSVHAQRLDCWRGCRVSWAPHGVTFFRCRKRPTRWWNRRSVPLGGKPSRFGCARGHSDPVRVASGARVDGQRRRSRSLCAGCDRGKPRVDSGSGAPGGTNRLLDALPADQRNRLMAALSHVWLEPRTGLFGPGQRIDVVDFPCTCVVSLITRFHDGSTVEVASVGNEGIVGVPVVLGGSLAVQAICSIGGWIDRMDATTFTREVESDVDLHEVVDDYLRAVFSQLSQAVACNRLHSTTERLARWLLAGADRLGTDELAVTHQLLGDLLGSGEAT